jgi:hypothetical protein
MSRDFPPLRPIEYAIVQATLGHRPNTAAVRSRVAETLAPSPLEGGDRFPEMRPIEAMLASRSVVATEANTSSPDAAAVQ